MPASASDKFKRVGAAGTLTTLSAPGKALAAATINVGSTTNWPTDTGIVFAIRTVNASGDLVAGTYTEWRGTVASGTSLANMTLAYGTDQVYAAGSTTQVFIPLSAEREDDLVDGLTEGHTQAGHHKTLKDDNGNEWLERGQTASAVNHVKSTNAATGNAPLVEATGDDTNVGMDVSSKGTGSIIMWAGAKARELLKLLNVASAVNEVSISPSATGNAVKVEATGDDTNIGLNLASKGTGEIQLNGVPASGAWPSWIPTWTNFTPGSATIEAKYKQVGKLVYYRLTVTLSGSTVSGRIVWTLPVTSVTYPGAIESNSIGRGAIRDSGTNFHLADVVWLSTTTAGLRVIRTDGTWATISDTSGTTPMIWANTDVFDVYGFYEAA